MVLQQFMLNFQYWIWRQQKFIIISEETAEKEIEFKRPLFPEWLPCNERHGFTSKIHDASSFYVKISNVKLTKKIKKWIIAKNAKIHLAFGFCTKQIGSTAIHCCTIVVCQLTMGESQCTNICVMWSMKDRREKEEGRNTLHVLKEV